MTAFSKQRQKLVLNSILFTETLMTRLKRQKFVINGFCHQHAAKSGYSHFEPHNGGDPVASLVQVVAAEWQREYDKTDRSVVIQLNRKDMAKYGKFYTALGNVTPTKRLHAYYDCREKGVAGELPFLHAKIVGGRKRLAVSAGIVVYAERALERAELMHEGTRLNARFHVITLLCNLDRARSPMPPVTLMRNHTAHVAPGSKEAVGGTAYDATSKDYLASILYWRNKLLCMPGGRASRRVVEELRPQVVREGWNGFVPVTGATQVEAFFGPAVPGGVPFVQFRSPNTGSTVTGKPRPRSPYELACSHARYLEMPEGEGLVGSAHEPLAEEYRRAVLLYSNHVQCNYSTGDAARH